MLDLGPGSGSPRQQAGEGKGRAWVDRAALKEVLCPTVPAPYQSPRKLPGLPDPPSASSTSSAKVPSEQESGFGVMESMV